LPHYTNELTTVVLNSNTQLTVLQYRIVITGSHLNINQSDWNGSRVCNRTSHYS